MCWRKGCLDIEDRRTVYYFDRLDVNGLFFYFFFFQAEDGIRDGRVTWSSDVCSSDLRKDVRALLGKKLTAASEKHLREKRIRLPYSVTAGDEFQTLTEQLPSLPALLLDLRAGLQQIGRASCRERV